MLVSARWPCYGLIYLESPVTLLHFADSGHLFASSDWLTLNVTVVERYGHWKQNDYLYIHFLTVEAILGPSNQPQSMFIVSYLDLHQICIHDLITTGPDNMNVWQGVISHQGDAVRIPGCFHVSKGFMQSLHNVNLCHPSGSFPAHNDVRLNWYGTFRYIGMVSVTFADINETIREDSVVRSSPWDQKKSGPVTELNRKRPNRRSRSIQNGLQ